MNLCQRLAVVLVSRRRATSAELAKHGVYCPLSKTTHTTTSDLAAVLAQALSMMLPAWDSQKTKHTQTLSSVGFFIMRHLLPPRG